MSITLPESPSIEKKHNPAGTIPKKEPRLPAFIHSDLDEYGFNATEFRIYCHLSRRAGSTADGLAFAAIKSMARICRMEIKTVRRGLKWLLDHKCIDRIERPGRTNIFKLNLFSEWTPLPNGTPTKRHPTPLPESTPPPPPNGTPRSLSPEFDPAEGNTCVSGGHTPLFKDWMDYCHKIGWVHLWPINIGSPEAMGAWERLVADKWLDDKREPIRNWKGLADSWMKNSEGLVADDPLVTERAFLLSLQMQELHEKWYAICDHIQKTRGGTRGRFALTPEELEIGAKLRAEIVGLEARMMANVKGAKGKIFNTEKTRGLRQHKKKYGPTRKDVKLYLQSLDPSAGKYATFCHEQFVRGNENWRNWKILCGDWIAKQQGQNPQSQ